MINLITNKIAKYFSDKAVARINANPTSIAKQHFSPIISILPDHREIKSLFWVGSYEYDLEIIEYFKKQDQVNNETFDKNSCKRNTKDEYIVDVF